MAFKLSLEQKQTQTLILSPQMQQAIHLLQLPLLELRQFLQQQLVQNPILEEVENLEPALSEEETLPELKENDYEPDLREEMERLAGFNGEWQEYLRGIGNSGGSEPEDEEKHRFFENSLTRQPSLPEHLLRQLRLSVSSPREEEIGETIIGNIDENGYLQSSLEELGSRKGPLFNSDLRPLRRRSKGPERMSAHPVKKHGKGKYPGGKNNS